MRLRVGSVPWLLRHEVRLAWRGTGGKRMWVVGIGGALLWAAMHVFAFELLHGVSDVALPPWATFVFGGMLWVVITLMLAQGILLSVSALFDRGDLDLLLSSPVSARTVFIVRGLGIAVSCLTLYMILLTPFAHMGVFTGRANLLAIYPTLMSLGLMMAALGMLLTLTLVRLLGARRARTVAQLIGAFAGAAFFLVMQAQNFLGAGTRRQVALAFMGWTASGGPLALDSPLWFPFRALTGEPLPLVAVMLTGVGCFWLVVNLAGRRFVAGTQESVAGTGRRGAAPSSVTARFRPGLSRNVLVKEWRLIVRDPQLITQTLMQMLYLLPLVFVVFRRHDMMTRVVPGAVMLSCTLAGSLAWITVAAEDAPELVGVAPVALSRIRWMKVLAALLPVWLLVSPLLLFLLSRDALLALVFLVCLIGGTLALGVTQIWYPRQGNRRDMKRRMQGSAVIALLENLTAIGWAGTAFCLIAASPFMPLALLLASLGPLAAWFLGKARREQGMLF
jgi:ABC-2 type transport system permease protein